MDGLQSRWWRRGRRADAIAGPWRALCRRLALFAALLASAPGCAPGSEANDDDAGGEPRPDPEPCDHAMLVELDLASRETTTYPQYESGRIVGGRLVHAGADTWLITDDGLRLFTAEGLEEPTAHFTPAPKLADLDGDGDLDLVAFSGSRISIFERQGASFIDRGGLATGRGNFVRGAVADADGDGILDVLAALDGALWVFTGEGDFGFALATDPGRGNDNMTRSGAADLDGDGDVDFFTVVSPIGTPSDETPEVSVAVWLGQGDGTFGPPARYGLGLEVVNGAATRLADIDGDGALDLAVRRERRLLVARGDGAGGFAAGTRQLTAELGPSGAGADVIEPADRGDGTVELLLLDAGSLAAIGPDGSIERLPLPEPGLADALAARVTTPPGAAIQVLVRDEDCPVF